MAVAMTVLVKPEGTYLGILLVTLIVFFFNDAETTEIYTVRNTLSLHDALPILSAPARRSASRSAASAPVSGANAARSEEHTSELQSLRTISYAVFCLKKTKKTANQPSRSGSSTRPKDKAPCTMR